MAIASINPATGEMLREFAALTQEEVENKLAAAESAFRFYRASSFEARGAILVAAADLLQQEADSARRHHHSRDGQTDRGSPG